MTSRDSLQAWTVKDSFAEMELRKRVWTHFKKETIRFCEL